MAIMKETHGLLITLPAKDCDWIVRAAGHALWLCLLFDPARFWMWPSIWAPPWCRWSRWMRKILPRRLWIIHWILPIAGISWSWGWGLCAFCLYCSLRPSQPKLMRLSNVELPGYYLLEVFEGAKLLDPECDSSRPLHEFQNVVQRISYWSFSKIIDDKASNSLTWRAGMARWVWAGRLKSLFQHWRCPFFFSWFFMRILLINAMQEDNKWSDF